MWAKSKKQGRRYVSSLENIRIDIDKGKLVVSQVHKSIVTQTNILFKMGKEYWCASLYIIVD